ncbi:hypothetical protein BGX34_003885 [Mortierella sp. NVP85]|nr:hypothetical protein BGX34_003885 [Mortierella sp. NVP85]
MSTLTAADQETRDKVFALPEICERISRSLNGKTITSCLRVSQAWHNSWLPTIWHTIDAGSQWEHPSFLEALSKHGDLIRILKCMRYDNIGLLFNDGNVLCKNLVTLVLPKTTLVNQADHARLVRQNPLLRDLSVTLRDRAVPIHEDVSSKYADLVDAIGELRFLSRLVLDENETLEVDTLETILSKCKGSLQELSLSGAYFPRHPFGPGDTFASGLLATSDSGSSADVEIETKETFGILSLYLDNVACSQNLLLNLVSRFPQLSRLSLRESTEISFSEDFPDRLARRCPKIKYLDISLKEDLDDDAIANLVVALPNLQHFFATETYLGNASLTALAENCRNLTVLDISTTYGIQGHVIQQLLEKCWSLRKLEAWGVDVNVGEMMVEAYKSQGGGHSSQQDLQGRWACHGLESLAINFDYDDSVLEEDNQQQHSPSQARRFIYEQLSKLKKLGHVAIGGSLQEAETDDADDHDACTEAEEKVASGLDADSDSGSEDQAFDACDNSIWIDFSLKSGLGLLSPLKDLHTLYLHPGHAIGVPEIKWMSKNWPNLKRIQGLYEDGHEEVFQWLRENRSDIEIDSD